MSSLAKDGNGSDRTLGEAPDTTGCWNLAIQVELVFKTLLRIPL